MKKLGLQLPNGYKSRRNRYQIRNKGTMGSRKKLRKYAKDKDRISRLPTDVTQLILEKLPLLIATRTSVVSKTWKKNWLFLRTLDFNEDFCEGQMKNGRLDGEKYCSIIANILLSHNGPIKKFLLHIPENIEFMTGCLNLGSWISFLSKNGVKNIEILNFFNKSPISATSNIFHCTYLMKLKLEFVTLSPPPLDFEGFPVLVYLSFDEVSFSGDSCDSLISMCPRLRTLILTNCDGVNDIVLNAPFLDSFLIRGAFESLSLEDIKNVDMAFLCSEETEEKSVKVKLADPLMILASSRRLEHLLLEGHSTKALSAGGIRSHPLTFNNISRLSLTKLDLSDVNIFHSTCATIRSCPNINFLGITVVSNMNVGEREYDYDNKDYDYDDKTTILGHLRKVQINDIKGTIAEIKLLHYLLAISIVLEELLYRYHGGINTDTDVWMLRELLRFPRASSKAKLLSTEKWLWDY